MDKNSLKIVLIYCVLAGNLPANADVLSVDSVTKDPTDVPPPLHRKPASVTVNLTTKEVLADIDGSGAKAWVWTYDGTIPGPMIRVMEGDTVTVNLTNDAGSARSHNIDLHAAMAPGGGAAATLAAAGGTKSFTFKAARQGTYVYHCAAEGKPWEHVGYGMYGLIVVEPKGGLPKVDREFYIGQNEWYHTPPLDGVELTNNLPTGTLMLNNDQALLESPTFVSFNGHKKALFDSTLFGDKMHATSGEKLRFFFVNGGPNVGSNWHIIGTVFDKTYQGHFSDALRNQETEFVVPGAGATFELIAPGPGKYLVVDHAIFRVSNGALGILTVDAK
jgi:nitrite reductase (NO-forming)